MARQLGLAVLISLIWNTPGLAQAAAECTSMMETRRASLQEAVRLCTGPANDALSCYDGARRFIRANQDFLAHQGVRKCPDADIAGLSDELIWARNIANTRASEARRIFLEQTLIDGLFVLSVNTLKSYVCMAMVNHHVEEDKVILPEHRQDSLVEETLPMTAGEGQQEIRFKNKSSGSMCGFIALPTTAQLGDFEERLFLTTKERIAQTGRTIARAFLPGGASVQRNGRELSHQFLTIVSDYQSKFRNELRAREQGVDAAALLAKRSPANRPIFIETKGPTIAVVEDSNEKAGQDYKKFIEWVEETILK
jgi:hypothetical protein